MKLTVLAIISPLLAFPLSLAVSNPSSLFHDPSRWQSTPVAPGNTQFFTVDFFPVFFASYSLLLMLAKAQDPLPGMMV
jgi:hypothetical protein